MKQNVMNENWDNLIVLDACRYDYFEKVYDEYLEGELEKRDSQSGATPEWLSKTFTDFYPDIAYHSANPYVNSKGVGLKELTGKVQWNATDHFGVISDLWIDAWDENKDTATPDRVVDRYLNKPRLSRNIIHFIQPHLPYIHPDYDVDYEWHSKKEIEIGNDERKNDESDNHTLYFRIKTYIFYDCLRKIIKDKVLKWKIRKNFVPPISTFENIYQNGHIDRLDEFYEYSLRKVLESISELIEFLDGKTIITADHGECFGEYNTWGHHNYNHNPILTTVPFLEVEA